MVFIFAAVIMILNEIFISLGSNIGNRITNLNKAIELLNEAGEVKKISPVYETAAWGNQNQAAFLNQVLLIETNETAPAYMKKLILIEEKMGRVRSKKWEARIIDLDILYFNNEIISEANLIIPHPHLQNRKFVLTPLNDIAHEIIHPLLQLNSIELLNQCPDLLEVKKYINE